MDLRVYDNCKKVVKGCEHVFNLAADMGGGSLLFFWQLRLFAWPVVLSTCLLLQYDSGVEETWLAVVAGMGFIQSNHSVIMYNNTMISFNMMEVARIEGIKR